MKSHRNDHPAEEIRAIADACAECAALRFSMERVHVLADRSRPASRPAADSEAHGHETWEMFLPLGQPMSFGGPTCETCRVPAGTILLIAPRTLHFPVYDLNVRNREQSFLVVLFVEECLLVLLAREGREHRCFLDAAAQRQWAEWLRSPPAAHLAHMGRTRDAAGSLPDADGYMDLLTRIFFVSLRALLHQLAAGQPALSRRESLLLRARSVIHQRGDDPALSLQALAAEIGCSPAHLVRIFREQGQTTFKAFLTRWRLERASWLLQDSSLSIKEIAHLTGWKNPLYFSTVFRKHNRLSPRQARLAHGPPD